ncbi:hypothetical protein BY458DRAFT_294409 [Sporodiniella umbellata]|nr:hypothetical protein BY458DRAFT_294409 [Sporodiniella umbellata]
MGNEKKQQILKPSNSTPVTTKPAVEVPVLDVSVSTPIKKPEPMIKTTKTKQRKLQRREELIDIDEVERPKPLTLSEKRIRQTERTFQIKKWKVREAREEREVRSQQRKAMTKGGSKKEIIAEETQKRRHVRFDLSKNKTHLITADV